jgi:hypothetical protein
MNVFCFFSYPFLHLLAALLLLVPAAKAQNTCSQTLLKAQFAYYEGRAEEVPPMLEACLKDGLTTEEKLQAYRLLTLTYLYLNEHANAEKVMLAFLHLNPTYSINEAVDPAEFINLYKQFRTWPVYLTGVKAGLNSSYIHILQPYSLDNIHTNQSRYTSLLGYQTGASLELPLKKGFSAIAELWLSGRKFTYTHDLFSYLQLQLTESQNRLDVPVLVNFTAKGKKTTPYLGAGITNSLLIKSQAQVRRVDNIPVNDVQRETTGPNITLSPQRRLFTFSGTINLGIKYTRARSIFIVEGRYTRGFTNLVRDGKRYSNSESLFTYGFIDNDITLNSFDLSVGYLIPVYKPRKLTHKKNANSGSFTQ